MLTLDAARRIVDSALAEGRKRSLKPLSVIVLDARGALKAAASEDGTSLLRDKVAHGKAYGALTLGIGSRALFVRAQEQPYFVSAINTMAGGALVPVPGGVLVRHGGETIGSVGISGDTSDNDEACAVAGIASVGHEAETG